jgi:hypothetical protein
MDSRRRSVPGRPHAAYSASKFAANGLSAAPITDLAMNAAYPPAFYQKLPSQSGWRI